MLKKRITKDEFNIIFHCYVALFRQSYDEDTDDFDKWEKLATSLIKEEAEDFVFFWEKEKKIKREIFRSSYEAISIAAENKNNLQVRINTKQGLLNGYSFYYGDALFEFLKSETESLLIQIGILNLSQFLKDPNNKFLFERKLTLITENLLVKGGIKI